MVLSVFANGVLPAMSAFASSGGDHNPPTSKVSICHANASNTNPYTSMDVTADATAGGHAAHTGSVWNSALSAPQNVWGDIIPPYDYGRNQHFAGLNWTTAGKAIYNNNCEISPNVTAIETACTFSDETTGAIQVNVTGTSTGMTVYVYKGNVLVSTTALNDNSVLPITLANLATGNYTVLLKKGMWTKDSAYVTIHDCEKVEVTPTVPTNVDECGVKDDAYTIPTKEGVVYKINGAIVTGNTYSSGGASSVTIDAFAANSHYKLTGQTHWVLTFDTTDCEVQIPNDPTYNDPCGLANASWVVPENGDHVTWELNEKGELIAHTDTGYIFTDGTHEQNYGTAPDSGAKCPVTPKNPKMYDVCGDRFGDYVYIPHKKGVTYGISEDGGESYMAYPGKHYVQGNHVVVTATPSSDDYEFTEGATSEWTFDFSDENCVEVTKEFVSVDDSNKSGKTDFGDMVVWKIVVTNTSDKNCDDFDVELTDGVALMDGSHTLNIDHLAPGESVEVYAYSMIGEEEMAACKAVNTVSFVAMPSQKQVVLERFSEMPRNLESEEGPYTEEGTATDSFSFTCPPAGNGGVTPEDPGTPEKAPAMPTELPQTGPSFAPMFISLGFSVLTYFITLKVQDKLRASGKA